MNYNVLVVDLDHTLLRTDLLHETALSYLKKKPFGFFRLFSWLLQGKAHLKSQLVKELESFDVTHLPYRTEVFEIIQREKSLGKKVILASASQQDLVASTSQRFQIFDAFLGTSEVNLKGGAKLSALKQIIGTESFAYIGDSMSDVPIWKSAAKSYLVNPSGRVVSAVQKDGVPHEILSDTKSKLKLVFKQLRIHQWVKNVLLFFPLVAAHRFGEMDLWIKTSIAAFGFCLMASFVYVFNDLADLEADRRHHSKRDRPLASGYLSIAEGLGLLPLLFLGSLTAGFFVGPSYVAILLTYLAVNLAYSLKLKTVAIVDVVLLAGMYTLRIYAGALATDVIVSQWLLAFSIFFFFGLAMVKRYTEIHRTGDDSRGYLVEDKPVILALGVAGQFLSVLVMVLYLNSEVSSKLYRHPDILWFVTPLLIYWTSRIWILANRDQMHDDPVVFAMKDRMSWAVGVLVAAVLALAL